MTNGSNGHVPHGLKDFTFPDSGQTVRIRRIAPMLIREMQRTFPPPRPPKQEVQFEKGVRLVPNPEHPDYLEAVEAYESELGDRILKMLVVVGVECEVDASAVAALREQMGSLGVTLDPDDKYVYVAAICASTADDLNALRDAILGSSTVTEAAVASATDRFPDPVPGA